MSILFLEYPPCSTCQKARRWLDEHAISYASRHIKENNPTAEELTEWWKKSGLPLKKFFPFVVVFEIVFVGIPENGFAGEIVVVVDEIDLHSG